MTIATLVACLLGAGALAGGAETQRTVRSFDGVPIRYRVQGSGDPALVFVHCWTCSTRYWDAQVPHFSRAHRVVTLDLAGHGASGKARNNWTIEAFGEDVAAVVRDAGLRKVVLIGHSMGGPVILEAAKRLPGRVVGLVPVDTLADVEARQPKEKIDAFLATFQADFPAAANKFVREWMFPKSSPPELVEAVAKDASAFDPAIGIACLRSAWEYDAAAALRLTKLPIVAVSADLWPTNLAANRRHASQFDLVPVNGLGHYLMREDPARFNQALAEALERIAPKPKPRS